jgi:hypothetical protein
MASLLREAWPRRHRASGLTKAALYRKARARHIPERPKMTKVQLENALGLH